MTPFTTKCIVTNLYLASTTTLCEPSCFKLTSSPTTQLSSWQMWWQKQTHWSQPTWQTNSLQAPQNQQLKNKSIGWDTEIKLCREPATCHWCSDQKGLHPWKQCPARGKTCSECGIDDHFSRVCLANGEPQQRRGSPPPPHQRTRTPNYQPGNWGNDWKCDEALYHLQLSKDGPTDFASYPDDTLGPQVQLSKSLYLLHP